MTVRSLRLIKKWLKAGVLDTDGQVIHPATGTPQGGIVSPILANVYLHYVLDLWFHKVVKKYCRGEACLIRYADDFVCAFQYRGRRQNDSTRRWESAMAKFGLGLSVEKTRVIPFHRAPTNWSRPALTFWALSSTGVKTEVESPSQTSHFSQETARLAEALYRWCKENRNLRLHGLVQAAKCQTPGVLQLLRSEWQLCQPE